MRVDPKVNPQLAEQKLRDAVQKRERRRRKRAEIARRAVVREARRIAPSILLPTILGLLLVVFASCNRSPAEQVVSEDSVSLLADRDAYDLSVQFCIDEASKPDAAGHCLSCDLSDPLGQRVTYEFCQE